MRPADSRPTSPGRRRAVQVTDRCGLTSRWSDPFPPTAGRVTAEARRAPTGSACSILTATDSGCRRRPLTLQPLKKQSMPPFHIEVSSAAWSPDGSRAAFTSSGADVFTTRYNVNGDAWNVAVSHPNTFRDRSHPTWSSDGNLIYWSEKDSPARPSVSAQGSPRPCRISRSGVPAHCD